MNNEENTSLTLHQELQLVDVELSKKYWENYEEFKKAILNEKDYQKIGKKMFTKKSGFRKMGTAFNISDEILEEEIIREKTILYDKEGNIVFNQVTGEPVTMDGQIISAKYKVQCSLPNGRTSIGIGSCSIFDKITSNDAADPSNDVLRTRFSNAEHDIPSTAHTRAKSRAISDIVGTGEVSAEEISGERNKKTVVKPISKTKPINKNKPIPKNNSKKENPEIETKAVSKKEDSSEDIVASDKLANAEKEAEKKGISVDELLTGWLNNPSIPFDQDMMDRINKIRE